VSSSPWKVARINSSWKRGFALFRTELQVGCHVTKHQSDSKFGMLTCDAFRS
jgi:hypothetical protein